MKQKKAENSNVSLKKYFNIWFKLIGDLGLVLKNKTSLFSSRDDAKVSKTVVVFNSWVAAICVLLFLFGILTSLKTRTEFSMKQFYPTKHPLLLQEEKIEKLFKIDKNLSVVVLLQTKDKSSWLEDKNYLSHRNPLHKRGNRDLACCYL